MKTGFEIERDLQEMLRLNPQNLVPNLIDYIIRIRREAFRAGMDNLGTAQFEQKPNRSNKGAFPILKADPGRSTLR